MAYQARHTDNNAEMTQDQRNIKNNANNVRNAADVAMATKNPYAVAAGAAVKAADKLTGGKSSEALGKAINNANKVTPGGKQLQDGLNKLNESGASDKIGQAASIKNGASGTDGAKAADNATKANSASQKSSIGGSTSNKGPSSFFDDGNEQENKEQSTDFLSMFSGMIKINPASTMLIGGLAIILLFALVLAGAVGGELGEFEDALGASEISGTEIEGINFDPSNKDAQAFYERINNVKNDLLSSGKSVDAVKIVAVYHILNTNNNAYDYDFMTTGRIKNIANSMFNGNIYDENMFRSNLTNIIFKTYFPTYDEKEREILTNEVFEYMERYFTFIGEDETTCASLGSCSYDIDGFYIHSKGNVTKKLQFSDLYVRLMQCGTGSGHNYGGTWGQPLQGEELVSFEKYILGVAYAEIGSSAPDEAIKAQMVAARSYILARPFDMGGWRRLQQESDGKWVLQVASCTQDHVYCDPDKGCSGPTNAQWGQVHSGLNYTGFQRQALASQHRLRTLANATMGEVLVNDQGYIIYSGYKQTQQKQFTSLANQGMNYKQILLQVYNQSGTDYNAADIKKMSCNTAGSSGCGNVSSGPYASWKQYQGPWINVRLGNGGTIKEIGCLATSISMLIAKSGTPTTLQDFNPGTFVEALSNNGGFGAGGNFIWGKESTVAPNFRYQNQITISNYSKEQKLQKITELLNQGYYVVAEVKGNTGQHWVAIDAVAGQTVIMMDPGSSNTDMWAQYNWKNTSRLAYFKVG